MKKKNKDIRQVTKDISKDFFEKSWEQSWTYIKTVVDVVREPMLILNKELCVIVANEPFYKTFQVEPNDTEHHLVYELGNGQWNIPALKEFLEDILPLNTFFKGFEVSHVFPVIGHKVMILNARQLHFKEDTAFPPIILLAMEDITEMIAIAERLSGHVNKFEAKIMDQNKKMEINIETLLKDVSEIKKNKKD